MALSKAPSVGFLFLIGGFILILKNKIKPLILLSFFFVWAYGGFLLLPIVAFIYNAVGVFTAFQKEKKFPAPKALFHHFHHTIAITGGIIVGLLIHPSFPTHFTFYWQQIFQIGLVNYQDMIGVGGEWYPTEFSQLLTSPLLLTSLIIMALVAFVLTRQKQTQASKTALIMTVIFFVFTLKSKRYIEYYIPWGFLFAALSLHASGILDRYRSILRAVRKGWNGDSFAKAITVLAVLYVTVMIPGIMVTDASRITTELHAGIPVDRYQKVGNWLKEHSTKGDIIFHNDWDDFPPLFYNAARDRFIVGLDPTFMYNYNPELYHTWVDITRGDKSDNLLEVIQGDFQARFVLVDDDHKQMKRNIIADGRFKKVYQDNEVTLFRVPRKQQQLIEDQQPQ